jgi:NAD(P)H-hydrate repair Nnr-like enzyme with NAD(P)H-hydrate dehydratase domain
MIIKGEKDIILGKKSFIINTEGGLKRCGGIGDILAGAISTCAHWNM